MLKVKGFLQVFCKFFRFNSNMQSFFKITCSHNFCKHPTACIDFYVDILRPFDTFYGAQVVF